jgi:hypothetical protein
MAKISRIQTTRFRGAAVDSIMPRITEPHLTDFNLDLGCSVSMTPFLSTLTNPTTSSTPVRLADSTLVKATHSGQFKIPLGVNTTIRTLVVPSLHKPLLLVGALCDKGFSICFDSTSCKIFKLTDLSIQATQVGEGYRRGNLFYLPSMADVRLPFKFSTVTDVSLSVSVPLLPISFDSTLLGYHCLLLHIGLRPLKAYLRLNGI